MNRFVVPKMIAARIETSDYDKFESILKQQPYFSLQDFVNFTITLFISGNLYVSGSQFAIKYDEKD